MREDVRSLDSLVFKLEVTETEKFATYSGPYSVPLKPKRLAAVILAHRETVFVCGSKKCAIPGSYAKPYRL